MGAWGCRPQQSHYWHVGLRVCEGWWTWLGWGWIGPGVMLGEMVPSGVALLVQRAAAMGMEDLLGCHFMVQHPSQLFPSPFLPLPKATFLHRGTQ